MCLICDRIQWILEGRNPYFVKELDTGYVVLGEHKTELSQLERAEKLRFLEEMSLVAEAAAAAFHADKMNYELLGNGDAHLHWHLFPRRAGDLENYGPDGKGPVWWYPREKMYSESVRPSQAMLESMKQVLLAELENVLANNR